jgi:hypothetical protein
MLKHLSVMSVCVALLLLAGSQGVHAQAVKWVVGGNMGISIGSGGGGSSAGFHFGPMAEVIFNRQLAVGTEFNINTQTGTPIEWANYFKYYIDAKSAKIKPYVDGGFGLLLVTGGPYFGIRFGGGVGFQVAKGIYVGPDLQLGPVFATGFTAFYITIRGGFRYEIP